MKLFQLIEDNLAKLFFYFHHALFFFVEMESDEVASCDDCDSNKINQISEKNGRSASKR